MSRQFGFGVIDAEAMVTRARHWINVPSQLEDSVIPDINAGYIHIITLSVNSVIHIRSFQCKVVIFIACCSHGHIEYRPDCF